MNIRYAVSTIRLVLVTCAFAVIATSMSSAVSRADSMNWDAVAQCESGGNWGANTGNGFYGGLQFKPATWASNGGFGSPAMASREEQIRVAENVLAKQGPAAWPTCGAAGGSPAIWNTSTAPANGCQAMPASSAFGFINFRQMCSAITNPFAALRAFG